MKWIDKLERRVKALQMAYFPVDSICSHHGVNIGSCGTQALITVVPRDNHLLFMFYTYDSHRGFSKKTFDRWRQGMARFGGILDEWNGQPGNNGISMLIGMPIPRLYANAIRNYNRLRDPFNLSVEDQARFAAFDKVWQAALKEAK
jgi:hypothetical protein